MAQPEPAKRKESGVWNFNTMFQNVCMGLVARIPYLYRTSPVDQDFVSFVARDGYPPCTYDISQNFGSREEAERMLRLSRSIPELRDNHLIPNIQSIIRTEVKGEVTHVSRFSTTEANLISQHKNGQSTLIHIDANGAQVVLSAAKEQAFKNGKTKITVYYDAKGNIIKVTGSVDGGKESDLDKKIAPAIFPRLNTEVFEPYHADQIVKIKNEKKPEIQFTEDQRDETTAVLVAQELDNSRTPLFKKIDQVGNDSPLNRARQIFTEGVRQGLVKPIELEVPYETVDAFATSTKHVAEVPIGYSMMYWNLNSQASKKIVNVNGKHIPVGDLRGLVVVGNSVFALEMPEQANLSTYLQTIIEFSSYNPEIARYILKTLYDGGIPIGQVVDALNQVRGVDDFTQVEWKQTLDNFIALEKYVSASKKLTIDQEGLRQPDFWLRRNTNASAMGRVPKQLGNLGNNLTPGQEYNDALANLDVNLKK